MNVREIKQLVRLLDGTDVAELSIETGDMKIVLKRQTSPGPAAVGQALTETVPPSSAAGSVSNPGAGAGGAAAAPVPAPAAPPTAVSQAATPSPAGSSRLIQITAPMVGTFYRSPSPDAEPYVQPGEEINVGQPLCIIEAMKLMNEIESEVAGRIVAVLVENGQPVEYGQPLFTVEPR